MIPTDKGVYSFSTCWNIKRHNEGRAMIEEIRSLGFSRVELNYNVTKELLETIEPMIEQGEIGISSVHNTFPHVPDPDYGTDSVLLGFEDEDRRREAVRLLLRSAEYAHRYGAEAVVVHPGEVPFDTQVDHELKKVYHEQGPDSPAYRRMWEEMLGRREALSGAYIRTIERSLEEVCGEAVRRGYKVQFGIETRSRCNQIPTLREADTIIGRLAGAPLGLWYDIGHGMMMERMGLYANAAEIQAMTGRIVGVHIHETVGLADHWCPYVHSGDTEFFDVFLPAIAAAPVKVYELKAACTPEDIEKSHRILTGKLEARAGAARNAREGMQP
ncbi:sugar phosphate isomerase/epimerase family protein [Gorillibacterium sp. sgz5001074]|uniref:sugar phosphate isomerase/epimerase family protein n=1 Tax=Gorillibacterium sp. sgz5001074 TaxID=3446695 RepID=UPI003F666927